MTPGMSIARSSYGLCGTSTVFCIVWMVGSWRLNTTGKLTTVSRARVHHMCQTGCDQPHSIVGGGSLQTQSVPTQLQNAYDVHEHCPVAVVALPSCSRPLAVVTRHTELAAARVRRRLSVQPTSLCIANGRSTILPRNRTCCISTVLLHWMVGPRCCITTGARATWSGSWA